MKHQKYILWIIGLFSLNLIFSLSYAQDKISNEILIIEGDSLENMIDRKLRASGNALLKNGDQTITADLIEYDQISEKINAKGQVKINTPETQITGSELELFINENTGSIPNATFIINLKQTTPSKFNSKLRGTASKLFLEGENKKRLENASITTCEANQDGWFITASEVEIDQSSENIKATNTTLTLKGFPILYSPYINFSFNDQRKSGFLMPSIGSTTRSGFETALPYYFNLSPTSDATLTPRILSKRGLQMGGEYRYIEKNYAGISSIEYLNNDNKSNKDNRYYLNLMHNQAFNDNFSGGFKFEKIAKNDNNYFSDMSTDIAVTSQVSLPQEAFISYSKNNFNAKLFTQKFQNLTNSSPYERLPSLTSSYYKYWDDSHGLPFLTTDVKFSYTQFERNDNYIGTSATGSRLSSNPSISAPIEADYGYIIPKLKLDLRNYNLKNANVKSKTLVVPTISVDSGLYFDKSIDLGGNNYTQTLEPRAFYSFTPYKNQSMLPMLDTALTELNAQSIFEEEQFSGADRIMDSHQITLALSSSIIDNKGFEWVSTTVAQRFYLEDREVLKETQFANSTYKNDTSDIFFNAKLHLTKTLQLKTDYQYNVDENHTNRATIRAKYKPEPGKVLNASYRLVRSPNNTNTNAYDIKQFNLSGQWPLGRGWSGLASYNYDILKSTVIEGMSGIAYDAGCWSAQLMFHRLQLATTNTPNDTFFLQIELGGLGSLGTGNQSDLFEKMNRNVPGSSFASDLPDVYRENNFK